MSERDIWPGVLAGVARFALDVESAWPDIVTEADRREIFSRAVDHVKGIEWHPRAERLFAEILTIGELSRRVARRRFNREEPDLKDDEILRFIGDLDAILNSLKRTNFP
jgi:hypothetical protein